jgi:hypothetical protein
VAAGAAVREPEPPCGPVPGRQSGPRRRTRYQSSLSWLTRSLTSTYSIFSHNGRCRTGSRAQPARQRTRSLPHPNAQRHHPLTDRIARYGRDAGTRGRRRVVHRRPGHRQRHWRRPRRQSHWLTETHRWRPALDILQDLVRTRCGRASSSSWLFSRVRTPALRDDWRAAVQLIHRDQQIRAAPAVRPLRHARDRDLVEPDGSAGKSESAHRRCFSSASIGASPMTSSSAARRGKSGVCRIRSTAPVPRNACTARMRHYPDARSTIWRLMTRSLPAPCVAGHPDRGVDRRVR